MVSGLSAMPTWGKRVAVIAGAAGVVAAGYAAERYVAGRALRGDGAVDTEETEGLGLINGRTVPVVTDDGVALHVEVDEAGLDGREPAVTVVFCHGLALDQRTWHFQRRDLDDVGRLVFWDQRGHGRSGRGPEQSLTIDRLGRDLAAVLEATAPDGPVVLVGHSMGGMTIMALADQRPELFGDRVVGVALVATSAGRLAEATLGIPAAAGRALLRVAPRALTALHQRPALVDRGRSAAVDLQLLFTKHYSFATDVPLSMTRFVSEMHANTPLDVIAELVPAFTSHDKLAALAVLVGVETLVLGGERDLMTPADHSRAMAEAVPGARLVVLPEAGHMVMLEHHDVVTDQLRGLVERALCRAQAARPQRRRRRSRR